MSRTELGLSNWGLGSFYLSHCVMATFELESAFEVPGSTAPEPGTRSSCSSFSSCWAVQATAMQVWTAVPSSMVSVGSICRITVASGSLTIVATSGSAVCCAAALGCRLGLTFSPRRS